MSEADPTERTDICGAETSDVEGPCQNPPSNTHGVNGRCWIESHQPDQERPGAPDGHMHQVKDGLNMTLKRRLDLFRALGEPLIDLFEEYYVEYAGKAENKTEAASLASAAVIRDELEAHLLKDGLFYQKQVGDPQELAEAGKDPDDAFVAMPKGQTLESYHDARREVRLGLKYEGVNDNTGSSGAGGLPEGAEGLWEGGEA